MTTASVLAEIAQERYWQDAHWGQQNHPNGTSHAVWAKIRDARRGTCDTLASVGLVTWLDIMQEEVLEAFAEDDPAKLRQELVQVAAVAAAWIEAIDRAQG